MFSVGDVIRSIPNDMIFQFGWEGVIVGIKHDSVGAEIDCTFYEIKYFDPEAADAAYLKAEEMEKLNDA
jgi:hypothetical protein